MNTLNKNKMISISSREKQARDQIKEIAKEYDLSVVCDHLGSCMIHIPSMKKSAKKLMISFPLDEYGYMVSKIHGDGSLSIVSVNTQNDLGIFAHKVLLQTRDHKIIEGYTEVKKVDFRKQENSSISLKDIVVYLGFDSKDEVKNAGIHIGDPVVADGELSYLKNLLIGRALDVQMGIHIVKKIVEFLVETKLNFDVFIGGVTQEKVAYRGAVPIATTVLPDINISLALDCETLDYELNSGVFVRAFDSTTLPNLTLLNLIEQQDVHNIVGGMGTSASFIHKSLIGIPSVVMGIHAKNLGTSTTICDVRDIRKLELELQLILKDLETIIEGDFLC